MLGFDLSLTRHKQAGGDYITHIPPSTVGWWPVIREAFAGAWQRGMAVPVQDVMTHPTIWACVTLIASDLAKLDVQLLKGDDAAGFAVPTTSSAFSPVLDEPNHYQTWGQFVEQWTLSKLTRGNTYVLKGRDSRNVVTELYVLDPTRVRPLVAPSGDVYYSCSQDFLSGVQAASIVVPAREIIHDRWNCIYHPLIGLSPIYAAALAATQGLQIQANAINQFKYGSRIGGILTAPGQISEQSAKRLEEYWNSQYAGPENAGKVVALGDGLKFDKTPVLSAMDSQLIDQLKWSDEKACSVYHVPGFMVGVGQAPNYQNVPALLQLYFQQGLQTLIEAFEACLEKGLGLPPPYEIEFDIEGLVRMDPNAAMKWAADGVKAGLLAPNEGRAKLRYGPMTGGESPMIQQQNYSLEALARRDESPAPAAPAKPAPVVPVAMPAPTKGDEAMPLDSGVLLADVLRGIGALTEGVSL